MAEGVAMRYIPAVEVDKDILKVSILRPRVSPRAKYGLYTCGIWASNFVFVVEMTLCVIVCFHNPGNLEGEIHHTAWRMHAYAGLWVSAMATIFDMRRKALNVDAR